MATCRHTLADHLFSGDVSLHREGRTQSDGEEGGLQSERSSHSLQLCTCATVRMDGV